jgi:hypothetical protein
MSELLITVCLIVTSTFPCVEDCGDLSRGKPVAVLCPMVNSKGISISHYPMSNEKVIPFGEFFDI